MSVWCCVHVCWCNANESLFFVCYFVLKLNSKVSGMCCISAINTCPRTCRYVCIILLSLCQIVRWLPSQTYTLPVARIASRVQNPVLNPYPLHFSYCLTYLDYLARIEDITQNVQIPKSLNLSCRFRFEIPIVNMILTCFWTCWKPSFLLSNYHRTKNRK